MSNLRLSKLLAEERLAEALRDVPADGDGRAVARALLARRLLTRFQAERLLAGRNTGFLVGPYRILDQLGRGGMGRVFKAEHTGMGRVVALKVLAPELLSSERARELFRREVRAAAQLAHPNVVAALDAGEGDGRAYLVLEYVDGPNLDQLVRQRGPLPVGLACDYVRQAAVGLQAAHQLGMVHRDIKPANLLVQRRGLHEDAPGLIKISDFGLARLGTPDAGSTKPAGTILARPNTVMGTPDFLSPEQARDLHRVDIRSDLYSLGCTFYYLLTGQVPFPGGTPLEKLIRHSGELARPVTDFRPDLPPAVVEIVGRLMAKSPDQRFQTPAELAAALEPFAVSGPTPWAPPPPSDPSLAAADDRPADGGSSILEDEASDEWKALLNSVPGPSPDLIRRTDARLTSERLLRRHRRRLIVACTAGAVAVALAVFAVMMALIGP